jgi:hypothetical protein
MDSEAADIVDVDRFKTKETEICKINPVPAVLVCRKALHRNIGFALEVPKTAFLPEKSQSCPSSLEGALKYQVVAQKIDDLPKNPSGIGMPSPMTWSARRSSSKQ